MEIKNLSKKQRILLIAISLSILIFGLYSLSGKEQSLKLPIDDKGTLIQNDNDDFSEEEFQYVEITGQVASPGVYQTTKRLMVIELIQLAGGLTDFADLETVHKDISLSSIVEDRQKIYIPALPEFKNGSPSSAGVISSENGAKININTASLEQLDALPDIGPATANKIIAARPYKTIEDLKNVEGIGDKTYNNLISLITL